MSKKWALLVLLLLALAGPPRAALGQQLLFSADYLAVVIEPGNTAEVDVTLNNKGETGQAIDLKAEQSPPEWKWSFEQAFPPLEVRKVFVQAGKEMELRFKATPPEKVNPGGYDFLLVAQPEGGQRLTLKMTVIVKESEKAPGGGKVRLDARYPSLSAPSGSEFEYRLELFNDTDEDLSFDLLSEALAGWRVSFKPEFENKLISSISLVKRQSRGITVTATPPPRIPAGTYSLTVATRGGGQELSQALKAEVLGSYQLDLTTPTGLLNARATAGRSTSLSLRVTNAGSAPLEKIRLSSANPIGWEVNFDPQEVPFLEQDKEQEVNLELVPAEKAIPGDYLVRLTASGSQGQAVTDLELRVTVLSATAWGWVGVFLVVLVLVILGGLFVRLGRR